MRAPVFPWSRAIIFAVLLGVVLALQRWVDVAIVGAFFVFFVVRALFRTKRDRRRDGQELVGAASDAPTAIPSSRTGDTYPPDASVNEPVAGPEIDMSPKTVAALRARGTILYIWTDEAGLLRARPTPPIEAISYETFFSHDCTIHIDAALAFAVRWRITWKRFPWPHFDAVLNADTTGDIIGEILGSL